jgi:hypothetical protein
MKEFKTMATFSLKMCITLMLLACVLSAAVADGARITAEYQPVAGGYRYYLTLHNDTDSSTNLHVYSFFALVTPDLSTPWDVEAPPGWHYRAYEHDTQVSWGTDGAPATWYNGVPPGESLSGLNVSVATFSTSFYYSLYTFGGGATAPGWSGYAYPELVPEPSALVALAGGLGALGLPLIRRRRKTS